MKNTLITGLYFLVASLFIFLGGSETSVLRIINKGLIIPVLMLCVIVNKAQKSNRMLSDLYILCALFFSFAGDVVLELSGYWNLSFTMGLACFLLAHIFYIILFLKTPGNNFISGRNLIFVLPVALYGIVLIFILAPHLGEMFLPVLLYTAVILTMVTAAINRRFKVGSESYCLVLSGAVLFLISDSMIALNRFVFSFKLAGIAIMTSYVIAQYLIVKGYLLQQKTTEDLIR